MIVSAFSDFYFELHWEPNWKGLGHRNIAKGWKLSQNPHLKVRDEGFKFNLDSLGHMNTASSFILLRFYLNVPEVEVGAILEVLKVKFSWSIHLIITTIKGLANLSLFLESCMH